MEIFRNSKQKKADFVLSLTDFPTFGHLKVGKIYLLAGHNQAKFGQDIKRSSGLRPPKDCVHVHVSII